MREELKLTLEHEIASQSEVITCRLACYEGMRRMDRQQFRQLLSEKLQAFGDQILACWEERFHREAE